VEPLAPVLVTEGASFAPVSGFKPLVDGAKVSADKSGGVVISTSAQTAGYQVGLVLPADQTQFMVVRYEIGSSSQPGTIGVMPADRSSWIATQGFGAQVTSGEIVAPVSGSEVQLVIEAANKQTIRINKLEVASFCVGTAPGNAEAPKATQCFPKVPAKLELGGAAFAAPAIQAVSADAQVNVLPAGGFEVVASPTTPGYQALVEIPTAGATAVVVRYALDSTSAPGIVGVLRGDVGAWIVAKPFGAGEPMSGEIVANVTEPAVKLIVESAAGAGKLKFKKLEFATFCETTPAANGAPAIATACAAAPAK
jgi:hypothetical protein